MQPTSVQIFISQKSRSIRLRVDDSMNLLVFAGKIFSKREIQDFISKNASWISQQLEKKQATQKRIQTLIGKHPHQILHFGVWQDRDVLYPKGLKTDAPLRQELLNYISRRYDFLSQRFHLFAKSIHIRLNWRVLGSCSHDNQLRFSLLLYFAPKALIDYVLLHELAHTKHKNHSKSFWDLVASLCPNHMDQRKVLRQELPFYSLYYKQLFANKRGK